MKERSHEERERALGGIALETIALDGISRGNKSTYLGIVCAVGGTWGRGNLGKRELGEDRTWRQRTWGKGTWET